jgi:hypothetical protein
MKTKLLAVLILAGSSLFAAPRVVVGFGVGVPVYAPVYAAPAVVAYTAPAAYVVRPGWARRGGYWGRARYPRAYWVAPRYYGRHYYRGYWRR